MTLDDKLKELANGADTWTESEPMYNADGEEVCVDTGKFWIEQPDGTVFAVTVTGPHKVDADGILILEDS